MAIINLYEDHDYGWTVMDDTGLIHPCQNFDEAIEKIREIGRRFKPGVEPEKVMLPKELTAENGAKYLLMGEFKEPIMVHGQDFNVMISWSTIKDIYRKIVDHYK